MKTITEKKRYYNIVIPPEHMHRLKTSAEKLFYKMFNHWNWITEENPGDKPGSGHPILKFRKLENPNNLNLLIELKFIHEHLVNCTIKDQTHKIWRGTEWFKSMQEWLNRTTRTNKTKQELCIPVNQLMDEPLEDIDPSESKRGSLIKMAGAYTDMYPKRYDYLLQGIQMDFSSLSIERQNYYCGYNCNMASYMRELFLLRIQLFENVEDEFLMYLVSKDEYFIFDHILMVRYNQIDREEPNLTLQSIEEVAPPPAPRQPEPEPEPEEYIELPKGLKTIWEWKQYFDSIK